MAIAAYDSDLTATNSGELTDASNENNWDESSNSAWDDAGSPVDETNFYIQGVECVSAQFTKTGVGTIIYIGTTFTVDTDGAILIWSLWASPTSLATYANGGVRSLVGNGLGDFYTFKASGSDFEPNPFGGWYCYAVDPDTATTTDTVGSPSGTWTHVGMAINATAQARGYPFAVDAIRVGRCTMEVTDGQSGAYGTFAGMASFDDSSGERYGVFQSVIGGYRWQGLMSLGLAGTSVDFRDSNANIVVANTPMVDTGFNKIEIRHTSSNVAWTNVTINAYGVNDTVAATNSPGSFVVVDNATVVLTTCNFIDMSTFTFLSNSDVLDCSFIRCGQITHGGGLMNGTSITESAVAADDGALYYNETADPDGEMDNMTFTKGTNSHHAIRFGTSVTSDVTLRGCTFNGFGSTADATDAVFRFDATGGTLNLNLVNCSTDGTFSVDDAAGVTVSVVIDPITEKVNVKNTDGDDIVNARVFVETAATIASGEMYQAAVTSLSQSSGTATCTTTAVHGLVTGDKVVIRGAQPDDYNKVAQVTVSSTTVFTYTVDSGLSSPATGTPVVSFVVMHGLTDSNGDVSASRTWGAAQQVKGWARKKNTTSPFYKDADISYAIDNTNGNLTNVVLQADE